jgi:hypothetical protein
MLMQTMDGIGIRRAKPAARIGQRLGARLLGLSTALEGAPHNHGTRLRQVERE